jgi:hypothetical protein
MAKCCHFIFNASKQPLTPVRVPAIRLNGSRGAHPQSLTTEIGQRLAGTAHRRGVAWAEAKLKAAGFENVHSEPFTFPAWIRGAESAEIVGSVPQHLAVTALGGSFASGRTTICLRLLRDRSAAKSPS